MQKTDTYLAFKCPECEQDFEYYQIEKRRSVSLYVYGFDFLALAKHEPGKSLFLELDQESIRWNHDKNKMCML